MFNSTIFAWDSMRIENIVQFYFHISKYDQTSALITHFDRFFIKQQMSLWYTPSLFIIRSTAFCTIWYTHLLKISIQENGILIKKLVSLRQLSISRKSALSWWLHYCCCLNKHPISKLVYMRSWTLHLHADSSSMVVDCSSIVSKHKIFESIVCLRYKEVR